MKKLICAIVCFFIMLFVQGIFVMAGSFSETDNPVSKFEITGGIDMQKDIEATFDETRTVLGTAEKGTDIVITVYEADDEGYLAELDSYETSVGVSGLFRQDIELCIGENYVVIEAYNGEKYSEATATIKRKKSEIKNILQRGIVLPGQAK